MKRKAPEMVVDQCSDFDVRGNYQNSAIIGTLFHELLDDCTS